MPTILFLAHTGPDNLLPRQALEALSAAKALAEALPASQLVAGLVGPEPKPAAEQLAKAGAARILLATGPELAQPRYASDVLAIEALVKAAGATHIVAPASSRWNRVMAGAAQRLGGRIDTHATGLSVAEGTVSVSRWFYRQRMEGTLTRSKTPWFILLEAGCFAPYSGECAAVATEEVPLQPPADGYRSRVTGIQAPPSDEQTIRPDAKLLFVAGAGWTKKQPDGQARPQEAEKLILDFLSLTQASLGSTKSLVDLSGEGQAVLKFMTHMNQVGQTGSTPRHPKGLATCCHGEEPHTVGWRFIGERRAVNLNPSCSWAQGKADVLYVADCFEVMRKVNALLASS